MSKLYPKLRRLDRRKECIEGEDYILLEDPLMVSGPVAIAACYEHLLDLIDGRSIEEIWKGALAGGVEIEIDDLQEFLEDLRREGLLDDEEFQRKGALQYAQDKKDETVH